MIELPEAVTIARQINETLAGRCIAAADCGNAPHKFAFYSRTPEEYEQILPGKTITEACARGGHILVSLEPGYTLVLGGGGERIVYHETEATLPKRRQLFLRFEDGACLTVTIQMWGSLQLYLPDEIGGNTYIGLGRVSPIDDAFTFEYFDGLFADLQANDKRAVKYFLISEPGVCGVGNGYTQDILFRARLHPRHRAVELADEQRRALYDATRDTLIQATSLDGRDSEHDLFDRPGRYARILSSEAAGKPCPRCATPIEKIQFLGGASYFCPTCQV
jgi:formamidopyrimidine-DNA glycosylase